MFDVSNIIKRAAEKTNFRRVRYLDRNLPTGIDGITIMPFFGSVRASFILSNLLLRRIKEESKASKYFILASWPGMEGLFPYVDEYWSLEDPATIDKLQRGISEFDNTTVPYTLMVKNLNHWFFDQMLPTELNSYYDNGFKDEFFERFRHVKTSFPAVPSVGILGADIARIFSKHERKVFIYPTKEVPVWRFGRDERITISKSFWVAFLKRFIEEGYYPVVYKNYFTHDLSVEVPEKCFHFWNDDILRVLAVMRASNCVVDIFSGISRMAIMARSPFVALDERNRYNGKKEFEIDDLCARNIPREYIFGFATLLESDDTSQWKNNIFDPLLAKLDKFLPSFDRDLLPTTSELYEIVPYDNVRKIKTKKLGSRFIKVSKE